MTPERWLLVLLVVGFAVVQYGLAIVALRDLMLREPMPDENRMVWGFVVLLLPIVGPVIYGALGPTRFMVEEPVRAWWDVTDRRADDPTHGPGSAS